MLLSLFKGKSPFATVLKWLFIALGLAVLAWGMTYIGRDTSFIKNAPLIADGEVDPANEGKFVVATGVLEPLEALNDPVFGIEVSGCPVLVRVVEMYQYDEANERLTHIYSPSVIRNVRVKDSSGITRTYENPPFPEGLSSAVFCSPTTIGGGELLLSEKLVETLSYSSGYQGFKNAVPSHSLTELPAEAGAQYGLKLYDGYYMTPRDIPSVGDLRVSFYCVSAEDLGMYTATGIQRGGAIVSGETADTAAVLYDREMTLSEVEAKITSDHNAAMVGLAITGLGLVAVGLLCWRSGAPKSGKQRSARG